MATARGTLLGAALVAVALMTAACGDDEDEPDSAAATAAPASASSAEAAPASEPATEAASEPAPASSAPEPESSAALEPTSGLSTEEAATEAEAKPIKVAFVYDGPVDDGGWNASHKAGQAAMLENEGVEVIDVENIAPGQTAERALDDLASDGYDLIVGTGSYIPEIDKVSKDHPDTVFVSAFGDKPTDNVGGYFVRIEDGRYLDGIVAGLATESGKIGYVGGFPIPVVVRPLNAFLEGVRSVNPEAEVKAVWTNSWYDPQKERQAAEALANDGADVLAMDLNSPAVPSVAEKRGLGLVGYGYDRQSTAPKAWLSSFLFEWGPYYKQLAHEVQTDTWEPSVYYGGFTDGVIDMAPLGENAPADAQAMLDSARAEIESGALDVFAGPIVDNGGTERVPEGGTLDDGERYACCDWLIEGVDGQIPS